MADYSHHHTYRVARTPHGASARRFSWILTVAAILMLAALGWVWTQQRSVDSPLPQAVTSAPTHPAGPAMAKAAMTPAPVARRAAPAAKPDLAPPSDAVAASGDTRAVN